MRIALVLEKFKLAKGGAERSSYELAGGLAELGHHVTLLAGTIERDSSVEPPFDLHSLSVSGPRGKVRWRRFQHAVIRHLHANEYDIVHSMVPLTAAQVYQPRGGSILYSARRHAQSYDFPLLAKLKRATLALNRPRQARIAAERKLCAAADGPVVAALSNYVAEQFKSEYNLPDHRLRVIPNGVATDPLIDEKAQSLGRKFRRQFDKNNDLALFLFAAQNPRLKGLTCLIQAAHLAARRRTGQRDFRILAVSGWKYASYWRLAQRLNLDRRVVFMGSTRLITPLVQMCDAVVLPTFNDACSRLILEALAVGRPAITTRFNGAAEFLDQGKYGLVIDEPNDVEALADALLQLADRKQHLKMTSAIEADQLREKVSLRRHVRRLLELYQQIIPPHTTPRKLSV